MKEIYKESIIKVPESQTLIVASALCGESFCLGVWVKGFITMFTNQQIQQM